MNVYKIIFKLVSGIRAIIVWVFVTIVSIWFSYIVKDYKFPSEANATLIENNIDPEKLAFILSASIVAIMTFGVITLVKMTYKKEFKYKKLLKNIALDEDLDRLISNLIYTIGIAVLFVMFLKQFDIMQAVLL